MGIAAGWFRTIKAAPGLGVKRISVTDTSFTGGAPGMMAYGNATADNWAGGSAALYSIGGTVSGLSGTVVLQDNGGDDLSVAASGTEMAQPLFWQSRTAGTWNVPAKLQPS